MEQLFSYLEFLGITILFLVISLLIFLLPFYFLQKIVLNQSVKAFGHPGIYISGLLGIPFHELTHYVFCKLFNHRVEKVKLISFSNYSPVKGWVTHTYDKRSHYQRFGLFFIGFAPLIGGVLLIYYLVSNFIVPVNVNQIPNDTVSFSNILSPFWYKYFSEYINTTSLKWNSSVLFWVLHYVLFSVAVYSVPSSEDVKNARESLTYLVILAVIVTAILYYFGYSSDLTQLLPISLYFFHFITIVLVPIFSFTFLYLLLTISISMLRRLF